MPARKGGGGGCIAVASSMMAVSTCCIVAVAAAARASEERPIVRVEQGLVRGTVLSPSRSSAAVSAVEVVAYKGIPFAEPPIGANRFAPPRPPANWSGVLDGSQFKHNCMQGSMNMGFPQPYGTQSEDCLYLNVYAPKDPPPTPLPIIFWIFGGGFQGGGGNETRLNGTWDVELLAGKAVIVTSNYRLNIFGFLASEELRSRDWTGEGSTGNYGIQDQRAALVWTKRNIRNFGGDPSKVFIVGQSAGANSVSQHLVRQKSWGLFSSAGLESGAFYDGVQTATVGGQRDLWNRVVKDLGCTEAKDLASCVAAASTDAIVKANRNSGQFGWSITVDGVDLIAPGPVLAANGTFARVPIIVGSVREDISSPWAAIPNPNPTKPNSMIHETLCSPDKCSQSDFEAWGQSLGFNDTEITTFVEAYRGPPENGHPVEPVGATDWYWAQKHSGSDAWATCPARRLAKWYTEAKIPAYWYYWTHVPDGVNGNGGAHHACEQPFVFHVLSETSEELKEDGGKYHINASNPLEVALSDQVVTFWFQMATSGVPGKGWPKFTASEQPVMIFGDASTSTPAFASAGIRRAKCDFWDEQFDKVLAKNWHAAEHSAPHREFFWTIMT